MLIDEAQAAGQAVRADHPRHHRRQHQHLGLRLPGLQGHPAPRLPGRRPRREETLVRGVEMVGTPLSAMNKIMATGKTAGVFNGFCGAESGIVPGLDRGAGDAAAGDRAAAGGGGEGPPAAAAQSRRPSPASGRRPPEGPVPRGGSAQGRPVRRRCRAEEPGDVGHGLRARSSPSGGKRQQRDRGPGVVPDPEVLDVSVVAADEHPGVRRTPRRAPRGRRRRTSPVTTRRGPCPRVPGLVGDEVLEEREVHSLRGLARTSRRPPRASGVGRRVPGLLPARPVTSWASASPARS